MLERESSVHRMESGGQCELDPGVRWIEFESRFLRAKLFRARANSKYQPDAQPASHEDSCLRTTHTRFWSVDAIVHAISGGNGSRRPVWMEWAPRSWMRE